MQFFHFKGAKALFMGIFFFERYSAPTLCQHYSYILSEVLGLPNEDMEILAKKDIIGTDPLLGSDMGGIRRLKSEK